MPPAVQPLAPRFWEKVEKTDTCWLWQRRLDAKGYGQFWYDGRNVRVHRFAYEFLVGPIPDGLVIDHLCRVRHCVNPAHMEVVTHAENLRRQVPCIEKPWLVKTHCKRGHELAGENVYITPRGTRHCRPCQRTRNRDYMRRRAA